MSCSLQTIQNTNDDISKLASCSTSLACSFLFSPALAWSRSHLPALFLRLVLICSYAWTRRARTLRLYLDLICSTQLVSSSSALLLGLGLAVCSCLLAHSCSCLFPLLRLILILVYFSSWHLHSFLYNCTLAVLPCCIIAHANVLFYIHYRIVAGGDHCCSHYLTLHHL